MVVLSQYPLTLVHTESYRCSAKLALPTQTRCAVSFDCCSVNLLGMNLYAA